MILAMLIAIVAIDAGLFLATIAWALVAFYLEHELEAVHAPRTDGLQRW